MELRQKEMSYVIAVRASLILGIAGLIASVSFCFINADVLIGVFARLALAIGNTQRLLSADPGRLCTEIAAVLSRIKIALPVLSLLLILWASALRFFITKSIKGNYIQPAQSTDYPSFPYIYIFLIILAALILRIININQSLWYDEIYSVLNYIDRGSFLSIITTYKYFNNHIFYSILARTSMLVFGREEWAFRLPSLLFGIAGIWAIAKLAGLTFKKNIMWLSAVLLAFSSAHIDQSMQARGYTALVFSSIMSCYYFLRLLREQKSSLWLGFYIVSVLGLYTHLYMVMVILSQVAVVMSGVFLFKEKDKPLIGYDAAAKLLMHYTFIGVVVFLLYLPVLPFIVFELFRHHATKIINLDFIWSVFKYLGSGLEGLDFGILYFIMFILGLTFLWKENRKYIVILTVSLFLVSFGINYVLGPRYLYPRFFIFALPVYLIAAASGIYSLCINSKGAVSIILITLSAVILISLSLPSIKTVLYLPRQDYKRAALFIKKTIKPGKETIIIAPGIAGREIRYYLRDYNVVKTDSLEDIKRINSVYNNVMFFITYGWTVPRRIMQFVKKKYTFSIPFRSRIAVGIYTRMPYVTNNVY